MKEVLEIVGIVDVSWNYQSSGRGCGGGRSASPATQIKYRQRWSWSASFLGWLLELSLLFHSPLNSGAAKRRWALSSTFAAVAMPRR